MKVWMPVIATGTGAETYADRLAVGLRGLGHEVCLSKVAHRFQYAPWLARLKAPVGTNVILANSWSAAAFAGPAPLVTVFHHVVHAPPNASIASLSQRLFHRLFVRPMERSAFHRSEAVIAVSNCTARDVTGHFGDSAVDVVLNGVDTDYFTPDATEPAPLNDRPLELLFVGKPSRRKGFDLLAGVVEALGDRVRLTVVGGAPPRRLKPPPARYLGRVDRDALLAAYRSADCLLFPSRHEGFGYAAAEAMACGLPVLCLKGGAVAEVVNPPEAGIAISPDHPEDLSHAVLSLAADPGRLASMRLAARRRAVEHLDHRRWLSETEAVLRKAAGE